MAQVLSLAQKRQAIEKGLQPYFDPALLVHVVGYWEQKYGDQPSFVLNRFISEICNTDELRLNRKEILKQLLSALADVEKNQRVVRKEEFKTSATSQSIADAFQYFITEVVAYIAVDDLKAFDTELKQKMSNFKMERSLELQFYEKSWMENIPPLFFSTFLTDIYALLCEFYGPAKSDQIYASIKNKLKLSFPDLDISRLL